MLSKLSVITNSRFRRSNFAGSAELADCGHYWWPLLETFHRDRAALFTLLFFHRRHQSASKKAQSLAVVELGTEGMTSHVKPPPNSFFCVLIYQDVRAGEKSALFRQRNNVWTKPTGPVIGAVGCCTFTYLVGWHQPISGNGSWCNEHRWLRFGLS